VVLDAGTPSGASVAWSSDQVAGIADFNGKSDLVLPPASLPASGSVTVAATLTAGGKSSTTSVVVPINAKPSCSRDGASGCLVLAAASDVFPGASFSAQSVGVLDDSTNLRRALRWCRACCACRVCRVAAGGGQSGQVCPLARTSLSQPRHTT
jgi:hypothetical protein